MNPDQIELGLVVKCVPARRGGWTNLQQGVEVSGVVVHVDKHLGLYEVVLLDVTDGRLTSIRRSLTLDQIIEIDALFCLSAIDRDIVAEWTARREQKLFGGPHFPHRT